MSALEGEVVICSQQKEAGVSLRVFGDEFYARYESLEGYTVLYDVDIGKYCYALLIRGHLVSSGIPNNQDPPVEVTKHLQEDSLVRALNFDQEYSRIRPTETRDDDDETARVLGRDSGLLTGRKLHQGHVKGLTILVNFNDIKTPITRDEVDAMMNGENYSDHGNFSSVKHYFELMSSGKMSYSNKVVGPIELPNNRSFYIQHSFVKEVVDMAVNQFDLDMSEFDSKGEGVVDAINILYAGKPQYAGSLWPQNSRLRLQYGHTRTHFYMLTGLGDKKSDLNIGTICHENGHMLCRFPDLYDYGTRDNDQVKSNGLGRYCLMSSGNNLNNGKTPSPLSPYLRDLAGWSQTVVSLNEEAEFVAKAADYGRLLKFETRDANEYFLVENRQKQGLDAFIPSQGLAIYHCDILGSNEWQQGSTNKHYQAALLQADGRRDLEERSNRGDGGDLFKPGPNILISDETSPHTRHWDGTHSGLKITNLRQQGNDILFTTGEAVVVVPDPVIINNHDEIIIGESSPHLFIPDVAASGVDDFIELDLSVDDLVKQVVVTVDISHSYVGDLLIKLASPQGTEVTLLDKSELGSQQDLQRRFDQNTNPSLKQLLDEAAQGIWTLNVSDHARVDVGRLNSWSIEVTHSSLFD